MKNHIKKDYEAILETLFNKGLFHIYQTSFSLRSDNDKFIINKQDVFFNEEDIFTELHYIEDLSWKDASKDAKIHAYIYQKVSTAKCIAHIFPISLVTYSLYHHNFRPIDYYGMQVIGKKNIFDIDESKAINAQLESIIYPLLQDESIFIIKGYGAYIYDRDPKELAKKASILENSAKILLNIKNV